ncbi:PilT protein domain-containing protein [Haloferax prahovense DSM 18310]|uniref:PilT protein domain-containing protein n=1 Tax=Haloferax prahovense (strain DSM 18310 / JCM 13924 / TL6) TaxID=1227461 RepID=M0FZ50_HALPT|nr:PIN domain-containing protein [Haloferax prahovense]ELZ65341.1 PilT protein domain-containing protein [Haloferax prahovense DSM 18310]
MYVETDFLIALVKNEDWLRDSALEALQERDDIHTSILAYAEVLVLFYDREQSEYDIDAPRAIANLLELVPITPKEHEDAVLAAAAFLEEYHLTPFDALHAGVIATSGEEVLSSEQDYDTVGIDRTPLEPDRDQ